MGVVYQARQRGLGRIVALKMMLAGSRTAPRPRTVSHRGGGHRPALSIRTSCRSTRSASTRAGRSCRWSSSPAAAWTAGCAAAPLAARAAAELLRTLAGAVAYAHEHGIIHRDLKPANILLDRGRHAEGHRLRPGQAARCRRLDAGLDDGPPSVAIVGTPSYMAPEQTRARQPSRPGRRRLCAGRDPVRAADRPAAVPRRDALTRWSWSARRSPCRRAACSPKVPRDLETICLKCLAKEQAQRYAGAAALADDLRRFLAGDTDPRPARGTNRAGHSVVRARNPTIAALAGGITLALCGRPGGVHVAGGLGPA